MENVASLSEYFESRFKELKTQCQWIREIRTAGMMVGVELDVDGTPVVQKCLERNLLINCTQGNVIRLLPAMNLSMEQAEQGCDAICEVLSALQP